MSDEGVDAAEISDDPDLEKGDRPPASRFIPPPKGRPRRLSLIVVAGAVLVVVAVAALLLSSASSKKGSKGDSRFATFTDQKSKISLVYPSAWTPTPSNDPNVPLLLNIGANGLDTLLVRVLPLQGTVNTGNENDIKAVTDAIISGTKVNVLQQQAIKVQGLLGYYYFYTLPADPASGTTLVHSHFFIFPSHEMVSLTFQTLQQDFSGLAHTFDQVVSSFRTTA